MACACGNEHKYACPACGAQSCSVDCSKNHKASTGCTGILDPTRYIPRGELLTVTGLDRDYNFLQKIGRDIQVEAPEFKRRARDLTRNNVKVRSMPPQMSRAKQNKSGWNRAKQCYLWTVELRKELRKGGTITHVPDTQTIAELTSQQAATLIDADGKKIPLRGEQTLAEALKDQSVVEFPTIYLGVSEESSESESDEGSTDEDSSDESSDEAPEEVSSKIPIDLGSGKAAEDTVEEVEAAPVLEQNAGPSADLVEEIARNATNEASSGPIFESSIVKAEARLPVVESMPVSSSTENIEPEQNSNVLHIIPQVEPELSSIIEETQAALNTEEPESLKKTLIEEI